MSSAAAEPFQAHRLAVIDTKPLSDNVWKNLMHGSGNVDGSDLMMARFKGIDYIAADGKSAKITMEDIKKAYLALGLEPSRPYSQTEIEDALGRAKEAEKAGASAARDLLLNPVKAAGAAEGAAMTTLNQLALDLHYTHVTALQDKLTPVLKAEHFHTLISKTRDKEPIIQYSLAHLPDDVRDEFSRRLEALVDKTKGTLDAKLTYTYEHDGDIVVRLISNHADAFKTHAGEVVGDAADLAHAIPHLLEGKALTQAMTLARAATPAVETAATATVKMAEKHAAALTELKTVDQTALKRNVWDTLLQGGVEASETTATALGYTRIAEGNIYHNLCTIAEPDAASRTISMSDISPAYRTLFAGNFEHKIPDAKALVETAPPSLEALEARMAELHKLYPDGLPQGMQNAYELLTHRLPVGTALPDGTSAAAEMTVNDVVHNLNNHRLSQLTSRLGTDFAHGFKAVAFSTTAGEKTTRGFDFSIPHLDFSNPKVTALEAALKQELGQDAVSTVYLADGDKVLRVLETSGNSAKFETTSAALCDTSKFATYFGEVLDKNARTALSAATHVASGTHVSGGGTSAGDTASTVAKEGEKGGKMGMIALGVGAAVIAGWAILERMKQHDKARAAESAQAKG